MTYSLQQFCVDLRSILKKDGIDGLTEISRKLQALLVEPTFVADTFAEDTPPGQRVLFHDQDTDVYVLAHVQHAKKSGAPHSHGASWAIYGNARGYTDMTEWKRINAESEDHAELTIKQKYSIGPGETHAYGPGEIHSTAHPEKAWVVRVTGTDLEKIPRFHFKPKTDKIIGESVS
jgi:predicted metal-dependent enzyme (double-stranded beta helix superfamily)